MAHPAHLRPRHPLDRHLVSHHPARHPPLPGLEAEQATLPPPVGVPGGEKRGGEGRPSAAEVSLCLISDTWMITCLYRPTIIHSVTLREDSDIPSQDHTKVRSQIMRFEASQQSSTPPRASVPESSTRKPKLRPTSTKGYTVNPQRPAPPPPPPPKK